MREVLLDVGMGQIIKVTCPYCKLAHERRVFEPLKHTFLLDRPLDVGDEHMLLYDYTGLIEGHVLSVGPEILYVRERLGHDLIAVEREQGGTLQVNHPYGSTVKVIGVAAKEVSDALVS
jgi:hypothetical protein